MGSGGTQETGGDWKVMTSEQQFRLALCSELRACKEILKTDSLTAVLLPM